MSKNGEKMFGVESIPEVWGVRGAKALITVIGAVGIARCLMLGGQMQLPLYVSDEIIPKFRTPDDKSYVIDHFFTKLFKLRETMQTFSGREEAERRSHFMKQFVEQLVMEVSS